MAQATQKVLITGGNAGLGFETARELLRQGFEVIITARTTEKGHEAVTNLLRDVPNSKISYEVLELKSLDSVHSFGKKWRESNRSLHVLINNAGIMNTPFEKTSDGLEAQFQVNYLSHFLLTHYVLPSLLSSVSVSIPGRVINLSSRAHLRFQRHIDLDDVKSGTEVTYDGWSAYGRSKLASIFFAKELARRFPFEESKIHFSSLHPGLVATKLLDVAPGLSSQAISVTEGIQGILGLAAASVDPSTSGSYFHDGHVAVGADQVSVVAESTHEAALLWTGSLRLLGLADDEYGR